MKKLFLSCYAAALLCSCNKKATEQTATPATEIISNELIPGDDWVWVANQASKKIEIYNPGVEDWNDPSALKWSWMPTATQLYSEYARTMWDVPNDFKVRTMPIWGGGNYMVACASKGLCTIATYPAGVKKWAFAVGTTVHPHAVELLPTGDIAVACTDQDSVKVYMSSSSKSDDTTHASFRLNKAHAVLWDPVTQTIRAIGNDHIVSLKLQGTVTNPILVEDVPNRGYLVNGGASLYGHDLAVDLNNSNLLWCTTNGGVYSFNKTTRLFTGAPGGSTGVNKTFVKGISRQNSGIFVVTRQDSSKNPQPANPVTSPVWCTRYVDFYSSTGSFLYYRTKSDAKFYKGKIFRTPY